MIKFVLYLLIVILIVWFGTTVPLGKRTFVGHIRAIWSTHEVQDLKEGVEEKAGPAATRIKHGVEKGFEAATEPSVDGGIDAPSAKPAPAHR